MWQLGVIHNNRLAWILLNYECLSCLHAKLASGFVVDRLHCDAPLCLHQLALHWNLAAYRDFGIST